MSFGFGFGISLWWSGLISHFITYNFICRFIHGILPPNPHPPTHLGTKKQNLGKCKKLSYLWCKGLIWQTVLRILILTAVMPWTRVCEIVPIHVYISLHPVLCHSLTLSDTICLLLSFSLLLMKKHIHKPAIISQFYTVFI